MKERARARAARTEVEKKASEKGAAAETRKRSRNACGFRDKSLFRAVGIRELKALDRTLGLNRVRKAHGGAPTPKDDWVAPSSLAPRSRGQRTISKLFLPPLDFAALGSHEAQSCLQGAQSTKNTTHRLLRPMATGLNVVSVTGSSAGCCFRRRRFCGRFLCCCCCEEGGGDWFPSPPPPEDEEARGAGAPAPGVALPSSFFSPLPLLSSGVAAVTRSRERRDDRGRATGATIRATCDADAAPGRAAEAAAERGARACCSAA